MKTAGLRELRQQASDLVRQVEDGEVVTITVNGRPVALLTAVVPARRWRAADDIEALFEGDADPDWEHDRDLVDGALDDPYSR